MPFCKNCGRQLAENEICNCTANQNNFNASVNQTPPPPPPPQQVNPQQVNPQPQNFNNVPPVQPYQPPKKKSSAGPIIAIIIIIVLLIVLVIGGILAAILVPAMIGYTKKSKIMRYTSDAKTIVTSFNASLVEMDDERYAVEGTYIISSDSSKSYVIYDDPKDGISFDIDVAKHKAEAYYPDMNECKWFVVIKDGIAVYGGASDNWNSQYVGTYPAGDYGNGPKFYNDYLKVDPKADLTDLYDWASNRLR